MSKQYKQGDLQVFWKPQVPCESFLVDVNTVEEATLLIRVLAEYDAFQFEHRIKPDYCNAGGLLVWEEGGPDDGEAGWYDWYDEDGNDIDAVIILDIEAKKV